MPGCALGVLIWLLMTGYKHAAFVSRVPARVHGNDRHLVSAWRSILLAAPATSRLAATRMRKSPPALALRPWLRMWLAEVILEIRI
jgi:hypothetical protein